MAVEAVNGANQQERQHSVGTAIGTGVATGVIGAGATYALTGGRNIPSLEKVFEQEPDKFESTMKKAKDAGKDEAEIGRVRTAYTTYNSAIETQKTAYDAAKTDVANYINNEITEFENSEALNKAVTDAETNLNNKEVEITEGETTRKIKYAEAKATVDAKQTALDAITEEGEAKTNAQKELDAAKENLKKFESDENAVKNAKDEVLKAKTAEFEKLAGSDGRPKELKTALADAESKLNTAKSEAMGKVSEEAKTAFGKIKGALKDIKWSKIGLWGGIAAVAGLILGYMLSSKPVEAPQEAQA